MLIGAKLMRPFSWLFGECVAMSSVPLECFVLLAICRCDPYFILFFDVWLPLPMLLWRRLLSMLRLSAVVVAGVVAAVVSALVAAVAADAAAAAVSVALVTGCS